MIVLSYSKENKQIEKWKEKLNELIVGYKLKLDSEKDIPEIKENTNLFVGEQEIESFLHELEKEINDWRTPRCGV